MQFDMNALGWSPSRAEQFEPYAADGLAPARVAAQHRGEYVVYCANGERRAEVAGRLRHASATAAQFPAVGAQQQAPFAAFGADESEKLPAQLEA